MASGNHDKLTSNNEVKLYFWCTELKSNQLWWPVNSLFNRSPFAVLYEWNESKVAADLGTGWTKTGCTEAALSHSDPEVFTVYFYRVIQCVLGGVRHEPIIDLGDLRFIFVFHCIYK